MAILKNTMVGLALVMIAMFSYASFFSDLASTDDYSSIDFPNFTTSFNYTGKKNILTGKSDETYDVISGDEDPDAQTLYTGIFGILKNIPKTLLFSYDIISSMVAETSILLGLPYWLDDLVLALFTLLLVVGFIEAFFAKRGV